MADEKKMTQVQALEMAADRLAATDPEVAEVLTEMVAKRRAPRKPRVNKAAAEFRAQLVEAMQEADGPMTNAELTVLMGKRLDDPEMKPQRVSNNIRVLEKEGVIKRIRGEKASDKDSFILA